MDFSQIKITDGQKNKTKKKHGGKGKLITVVEQAITRAFRISLSAKNNAHIAFTVQAVRDK